MTHGNGLPYMAQLDTIRFAAVFLVLMQHFAGLRFLPFGHLGVLLFFVLSGFLITGILLRSRDEIDAGTISGGQAAKQFYFRRILRIFPLYFFVVIVFGLLLNLYGARQLWAWLLFYAMNIQVSIRGHEGPYFSVFWSLAIEEQFYCLWPWVVLFAPRKWIPVTTALMILAGPAWRLYAHVHGLNLVALYKATPACLDALGIGALLAQVHHSTISAFWRQRALNLVILPGSLLVAAFVWYLSHKQITWTFDLVLFDTAICLAFAWLISTASEGFGGAVGWLLNLFPLRYFGKITYGIYVYHGLVQGGLIWLMAQLGVVTPEVGWFMFSIGTLMTIAVASLSWHYFEYPINKLKDKFGLPRNKELERQPELVTQSARF